MSFTVKGTSAKNDFVINDLVFAKVRGHPFWPAKITNVDRETYRHKIKYKVNFFGTNETVLIKKIFATTMIIKKIFLLKKLQINIRMATEKRYWK